MGQKIHPTGFRLPVTAQLGVALVRVEQRNFADDAGRRPEGARVPEGAS